MTMKTKILKADPRKLAILVREAAPKQMGEMISEVLGGPGHECQQCQSE
jgi:hypothetical protein